MRQRTFSTRNYDGSWSRGAFFTYRRRKEMPVLSAVSSRMVTVATNLFSFGNSAGDGCTNLRTPRAFVIIVEPRMHVYIITYYAYEKKNYSRVLARELRGRPVSLYNQCEILRVVNKNKTRCICLREPSTKKRNRIRRDEANGREIFMETASSKLSK